MNLKRSPFAIQDENGKDLDNAKEFNPYVRDHPGSVIRIKQKF